MAVLQDKLDLRNEEQLWAIPQFHVVCEEHLISRDPRIIEPARAEGRLWTIDTGHDLMITEPGFVATTLAEIADH